ncbi:MAG TPA: hypothetical protein PLV45_04700 [bacterium]|nr:hypothetical protein [bacterium]
MIQLSYPKGPGHGGSKDPIPYRQAKAHFEKAYLTDLLSWANGNVKRAAEQAGRDRKGLYILMAKHGIEPSTFRKRKRK